MPITDAQLRERRNWIGGSDAAKIMGLSKWGTPLSVWASKVMPEEDQETSEAAEWGNKLESLIISEFTERTGEAVHTTDTVVHPEYPFIRANLDGLVGEDAILEAKTTNQYKSGEWKDDSIPADYIVQCQYYLGVTGRKLAHLCVLIGGQKFVHKTIERDEVLIGSIISNCVSFWNKFVLTKQMPMAGEDDADLLERMYPDHVTGAFVELSGTDAAQLLEKIKRFSEREKNSKSVVDDAKAKLKQLIEDNETATINGQVVATWKTQTSERIDTKRIKEEAPEVFRKYSKETKSRTLRIKEGE